MLPVLIGLGAVVLGGAAVAEILDDNKKDGEVETKVRKVNPEEVPERIRRKKNNK